MHGEVLRTWVGGEKVTAKEVTGTAFSKVADGQSRSGRSCSPEPVRNQGPNSSFSTCCRFKDFFFCMIPVCMWWCFFASQSSRFAF